MNDNANDYDFADDMDAFGEPDTKTIDVGDTQVDDGPLPERDARKDADLSGEADDYDFPEDPDGGVSGETPDEPKGEGEKPDDGGEDDDFVAESDDFEPEILERALKFGLDSDKMNALGDDALRILERLEQGSSDSATDKTSQDGSDFEFKPLELKITEDQFDPELVAQFKAMNEHFGALFKEQSERHKATVDALQSQLQTIENERFVKDFDAQVGKLGDEWSKLLGKGETLKLDEKSAAYKNRKAIADEMSTIASGLKARGRAVPSDDALFQRAMRSVMGDKYESTVRASIAKQSQDRKAKTFTPRGTGTTKSTPKSGRDKAIANLSARFREAGITG